VLVANSVIVDSYHNINFNCRGSELIFQSYIVILTIYNCLLLYHVLDFHYCLSQMECLVLPMADTNKLTISSIRINFNSSKLHHCNTFSLANKWLPPNPISSHELIKWFNKDGVGRLYQKIGLSDYIKFAQNRDSLPTNKLPLQPKQ